MPNEDKQLEQEQSQEKSQQEQSQEESSQELSDFDKVLESLPEDQRKTVEDAAMRQSQFTKVTTMAAREKETFEQERNSLQKKAQFYDKFIEDEAFRQDVLKNVSPSPQSKALDPFDDKWEAAQEHLNSMDKDAKDALNMLVEKKLRERLDPFDKYIEEQKQDITNRHRFEEAQRLQEETQVYTEFEKKHPDFKEAGLKMKEIADSVPGLLKGDPKKLPSTLETLYQMATVGKQTTRSEQKGAEQILKQNETALRNAAKATTTGTPSELHTVNEGRSFDEVFDSVWKKHGG